MTRLFSYKVRYDVGFAPNPFHGVCTLATCKPRIRKSAAVGDWICGVGSAACGTRGQLVFAMQVDEKVTFDQYWTDPRFEDKKVDLSGSRKYRYGDNVYHRKGARWVQERCRHSLPNGKPNADHIAKDTSADSVLIGRRFTYWGSGGPIIPDTFRDWDGVDLAEPGRDYTSSKYSGEMVTEFVKWIDTLTPGCCGAPAEWPE